MSRFHLVYYREEVLIVRSGLCIDLYVFIVVHRFLCEVQKDFFHSCIVAGTLTEDSVNVEY